MSTREHARRTRRRLTPDARRRDILRAATIAFATRPYAEVHVGEIAEAAGTSRALVHHYFGDKRALFLAAAREVVERTPRTVRTDLDLDPEAMVDANTALWLDMIEGRRDEASLLFLGAGPAGVDAELAALQDELRDRIADRMLVNHLGTADVPPAARAAARAATGLVEQALRDWLLDRGVTRAQVHAIVSRGILAVMRDVLPAALAADEPAAARDERPDRDG